MFCSHCGSEVDSNTRVCPNCGGLIEVKASAEPIAQEQIKSEPAASPVYSNTTDTNNGGYTWSNNDTSNTMPSDNHPKFALWLTLTIITTLCCCQVLGIIGIVFTVTGNSAYKLGRYDEADSKMNTAKILTIIGMIVGVIVSVLCIILISMGAFSSSLYY